MEIKYGRKRRGIKKEAKDKIDEWLLTIDNAEVIGAIKKDIILTGGSICSMLMGDKVNDFDFYFKTKETTELVAKYYVDKFNESHKEKLKEGTISYTPEVRTEQIENIKGEVEDRVIIFIKSAGVVSEEQDEYGYFEMMGEEDAIKFAESFKEKEDSKEKYRVTFLSQNAITLSDKVQIVIRFYGQPDQIHNNYDFVHAKCYYDYDKDHLELNSQALECMLSYSLVYEGSLYPIASIFRMKKFLERGWRITAGQQLKIMWQISEIDLSNPKILREQLTGVDMAYMWQLIQALSGVDPAKIDSAYISTIIDKIFD